MAQKPVDNITQIIGGTPVVKLRNVMMTMQQMFM